MRPDLLIPLDCLPGPVPVGAPVSAVRGIDGERRTGVATEWHPRNGLRVAWPDGAVFYLSSEDAGTLDLSRPPVDAAGYPTRIDGAEVAAALLARAMGLDPAGGVIFQLAGDSRRSDLFNPSPLLILWLLSTCSGDVEFSGEDIPALANIDPQHPDAARLALAAVIRSKPWET